MFVIEVNGKEQRVFFKHEKQAENHPTGTTCFILDKETNAEVARGVAKCNPADRFNYESGRKLALARALTEAGFDRNARGMAWNAYRKRGAVQVA